MSNEKQPSPPISPNNGAFQQHIPVNYTPVNSPTYNYGPTSNDLEIQNAGANMTQRQSQRDSTVRFDEESMSDAPKKEYNNVDIEEVRGLDDGIDWKPGFLFQFPWIGFAGLITIIVATSFAVGVLVASNKKRVKEWPYASFPIQPNVLLNICNQLGNLGLLTVVGQGLAIAWWRKAMRGSSLKTLHRNHAYSYSFFAIVTSGKKFNIVALAALMTKFAVVDSTLFQKATKTIVTQEKAYTTATVTAWMDTKWPTVQGGNISDNGTISTIDAAWVNVLDAYTKKIANGKLHDNLRTNASFFDCPYQQECAGIVEGIGFSFNCSSTVEDVDYGLQQKSQLGGAGASYPLWNLGFSPEYATDKKPYASIILDMMYVNSEKGTQEGSCPGLLVRRRCEIRPAKLGYPVTVMTPSKQELAGENIVVHVKFNENANLSYPFGTGLDNINQIDHLKVIQPDDHDERRGNSSTVGTMAYILQDLYSSTADLQREGDKWDLEVRGGPPRTIFYSDSANGIGSNCWYPINKPKSDDPLIDILRKVNTFSFVTGLYLSGGPTLTFEERKLKGIPLQKFHTSVTGIVEQYQTNYNYMGGAIVATFITLLLVLPVYWGFWELGRKVTLGPLEIANAFNAPIIKPSKTKSYHGDFDEVLQDVGKRRVQYGQLVNSPAGEMGIAEPHRVRRPDFRHSTNVDMDRKKVGFGIGAAIGGLTAAAVGAAKT